MSDKKYPKVITQKTLDINAHISDDEIRGDIEDTLAEISTMTKRIEAFEELLDATNDLQEKKLIDLKISGSRMGINSRIEFVEFLELLLKTRKEQEGKS